VLVWRWRVQPEAVEDARGQKDLLGRELKITRKAVADNLVSSAQIVMGEGDEGIPAAIIRDSSIPIREVSGKIPTPSRQPPRNACTLAPWLWTAVLTPRGYARSLSRRHTGRGQAGGTQYILCSILRIQSGGKHFLF